MNDQIFVHHTKYVKELLNKFWLDKYVKELLNKFGLDKAKTMCTPMLYLTAPDILFSVSVY